MRRLLFAVLLLWGGGAWAETATLTPDPGSCIASLTGCTIVGPLTVDGLFTLNVNPTDGTGNPLGDILSNTSTYAYPSSTSRARYWASILDTTGTPQGLYESDFHFTELTAQGVSNSPVWSASNPLVTATLSGGVIVTPLTITQTGTGLPNGTYGLVFFGGGGTGAVGTATVSGGIVTAAACSPCGTGYTSVPTVGIAIGTVAKETNIHHNYGQIDAGVYDTALFDPEEVSFVNNGMFTGTAYEYNALFHNGAYGVSNTVYGVHCQTENDNPNTGSMFSSACINLAPLTGQTPTGTGGSITAAQSGGTVTLSFVAGSGYQNGTWPIYFTGGSCARQPTGTFTVTAGAIASTNLTFAGSGCASNPTAGLFFGSFPTYEYSELITDSYSTFATQGNMLITDSTGNLTPPAQNNMLTVKASSSGLNQYLFIGTSAVSGGNAVYFTAGGTGYLYGALTMGLAGHSNGGLIITNATASSGNITILPPTGTTLSNATVTLPDATGTLAEFVSGALSGTLTTWTDVQTCTAGQITWDANYIYVCTATNTVKRASLATF